MNPNDDLCVMLLAYTCILIIGSLSVIDTVQILTGD